MYNRRKFIKNIAASTFFFNWISKLSESKNNIKYLHKKIPKFNRSIPCVGMGTWLTFDVAYNTRLIKQRSKVLKAFFDNGGIFIDSSPMYGTSERVLGKCLSILNKKETTFSATKIWTPNKWYGKIQYQNSLSYWDINKLNLLQVHNLLSYQDHLDFLFELKKKKKIDYVGVTTSHGRRHKKLRNIMENYDLDFIQVTYNLIDRDIESYILPIAKEKKIGVIANRPFVGGHLFNKIKFKELPEWLRYLGIESWSELFLKYIISHEDITCTIPATTKVEHMLENMRALKGNLLNKKERIRLQKYFSEI